VQGVIKKCPCSRRCARGGETQAGCEGKKRKDRNGSAPARSYEAIRVARKWCSRGWQRFFGIISTVVLV
jgi:hypothetical protein